MTRAIVTSIVVAIGLLVTGFIGWSLMKQYAVSNYASPTVTLFHSGDELFVFIGKGMSTIVERRAATWLRTFTGTTSDREKLREDLLVFHLKGGKLTKSQINLSGFGGSPFAFQGQVYWGKGRLKRDTGPLHWRWNGKEFVVVSDAEWGKIQRQIDKEFKLYSDMNAKEGWTEKSLRLHGQQTQLEFRLAGKDVRLVADVQEISEGRNRIVVTLSSSGNGTPEVLIDEVEGYRVITPEEYQQLR